MVWSRICCGLCQFQPAKQTVFPYSSCIRSIDAYTLKEIFLISCSSSSILNSPFYSIILKIVMFFPHLVHCQKVIVAARNSYFVVYCYQYIELAWNPFSLHPRAITHHHHVNLVSIPYAYLCKVKVLSNKQLDIQLHIFFHCRHAGCGCGHMQGVETCPRRRGVSTL